MPATLRKSKVKSPARVYEHSEKIEQAATRELLRLELASVKESVNRLWQIMLGGFALMTTIMIYLHSDTKSAMRAMEKGLKVDMQAMELRSIERHKEIKEIFKKNK